MNMDPLYLFSAIVWSAVGLGFFIYGRKRQRTISLFGGILLMGVTYAARTTMTLFLVSAGIVAGIYLLNRRF